MGYVSIRLTIIKGRKGKTETNLYETNANLGNMKARTANKKKKKRMLQERIPLKYFDSQILKENVVIMIWIIHLHATKMHHRYFYNRKPVTNS